MDGSFDQEADQDRQKTKATHSVIEKLLSVCKIKRMISRFLRVREAYLQKTKAQLNKRYIELAEEQ